MIIVVFVLFVFLLQNSLSEYGNTKHDTPSIPARLLRIAAALMVMLPLCACSFSGDSTGEQTSSPSPAPAAYYSTGSDALTLNLSGGDCRVESDGSSIFCEYENGETQFIRQIELDEAMFFFPAEVENLDGPGIVVSDKTGNGFGLISFYRHDSEQNNWRQVPFSCGEASLPDPVFIGHADLNNGVLELSCRDQGGEAVGGWSTVTYQALYSPEQDALVLEKL